MSFSALPTDLVNTIVDFCKEEMPINNTVNALKSYAKPLFDLSLVCKDLKNCCEVGLANGARKFELISKYSIYQKQYEHECSKAETQGNKTPVPSPHLCDALMTDVEGVYHYATNSIKNSQKGYNSKTEKDINDIMTLMPQSIGYLLTNEITKGSSKEIPGRRRQQPTILGYVKYSTLALACLNPHVSLDIIKTLLRNGESLDEKNFVTRQRKKIPLLEFLEKKLSDQEFGEERMAKIKELAGLSN